MQLLNSYSITYMHVKLVLRTVLFKVSNRWIPAKLSDVRFEHHLRLPLCTLVT